LIRDGDGGISVVSTDLRQMIVRYAFYAAFKGTTWGLLPAPIQLTVVMTSSKTAHASHDSEATCTEFLIDSEKLTPTTDSMTLCAEHACWSPLPISSIDALKEHFPEVIRVMSDRTDAMYILDMETFFVIKDGIYQMNAMIGGDVFYGDPCEACRVIEFFLGDGGFVFMMGLVRLEKCALYKECFEFMRPSMGEDKVEPYHRMMMCSRDPEMEPVLKVHHCRPGNYWAKRHGTVAH
jgi:hypothetical protein